MSDQLPPDFPPDLRKALGVGTVKPTSNYAPITDEIRKALEESRKTKGRSH